MDIKLSEELAKAADMTAEIMANTKPELKSWNNTDGKLYYFTFPEIATQIQTRKDGSISQVERRVGREFIHAKYGAGKTTFYDSGEIERLCFYIEGKLHDYNGRPAITKYNRSGQIYQEEFYNREDGLINIFYYEDGTISVKQFGHRKGYVLTQSELDRKSSDGPAQTTYFTGAGAVRIKSQIFVEKGRYVFVNEETPTVEIFHPNGKPAFRAWGYDGRQALIKTPTVLHRLSGPALQEFDENGNILTEEWRKNGKLHNHNGPALKQRVRSDHLRIVYSVDGNTHRPHEQGPAVQVFKNDKLAWEQYVENAILNRPYEAGPAYIKYDPSGKITEARYKLNGEFHRPAAIGPAHIIDHYDGKKVNRYYEFGQKVSAPLAPKT